jgi:hypothetical protein
MKTEIEFELRPFSVPSYVSAIPNDLGRADHEFPLSQVPSEYLHMLCEEFYREVFKRAGKTPPTRDASIKSR